MIEFINVSKAFGSKVVLKGFNLKVNEGDTVSLVGFSGSGKSISLKKIVGLIAPDEGTIRVDGLDVQSLNRHELYELRRNVGFVFQFAALFDSMTIAENLAMGLLKAGGYTEDAIRERIEESLRLVELEGFGPRLPSELSGGQKKRAGLARAIAFRPKYLLYDEPTSGLDPVTTAVIDRLILRMRDELGVTSIVVTHDMRSAERISNRIAMLYDGRILEEGTPEELFRSTNPIVRGFVDGRPELVEQGNRELQGLSPDGSMP
ncbi:MAG: ABC transporter ATP-binding protein [Gemmatimonadota bacterium]|jgi:phospholipid/cholesterol/gamma-HCH transport system ATP-binding protein|nr:ABC transporter ATP-binding protein [Gemmatimonadota bacterium]